MGAKSGNKIAKHLALSGCRTAYPTLEVAKTAIQPMITGNEDDIESFDPNEVMAKAYMTKKPEVSPKSQGGPLAFLGLQKTTGDSDIPEKIDESSREKKIIEDKSVDGWTTEKIDESKEKKITEDKSVDGWTKETNSKNVEKEATNETEEKKDDTSTDDDGSHGETNSNNVEKEATKETAKKKDDTSTDDDGSHGETNSKNFEKEATNETEKKKDDTTSTDDGSHGETEQDDKNTGNEKDDGMEI